MAMWCKNIQLPLVKKFTIYIIYKVFNPAGVLVIQGTILQNTFAVLDDRTVYCKNMLAVEYEKTVDHIFFKLTEEL